MDRPLLFLTFLTGTGGHKQAVKKRSQSSFLYGALIESACPMLSGGRLEADISSMPFSSILGLHLDRHEAEVAAIINAASKELTIELELKKLNEMWREQRLEVYKYTRGGAEERGLILRGTLLEDRTIPHDWAPISILEKLLNLCISTGYRDLHCPYSIGLLSCKDVQQLRS